MSQFEIPAKPWKEADIKALMAHADFLPDDVRAELGLPAIGNEPAADENVGGKNVPPQSPAAAPAAQTNEPARDEETQVPSTQGEDINLQADGTSNTPVDTTVDNTTEQTA